MGRLWLRVLFKPSQAVTEIVENPEAPVLALLPVIAGIIVAASVVAGFKSFMTIPGQLGAMFLVGPPAAMLSSWWAFLSISWAARAMKHRLDKGRLTALIAWSWLPVGLLSLVSAITAGSLGGNWLLSCLFLCGLLWQLVLIAIGIRSSTELSWKRTVVLLVIATLIFVAGWAALGSGVTLLEGDLFKTAVAP